MFTPGNYPWSFPEGRAGKPDFSGLLRKHRVEVVWRGQRSQPSHHLWRRKEKSQLGSALNLHPVGSRGWSSTHRLQHWVPLGVTGCHWVPLRFGRRTDAQDGRVCHCVCVCGWRVNTHVLRSLSADCENMFAWDKSTKTHPSRGPNTPCAAVDTGLTT